MRPLPIEAASRLILHADSVAAIPLRRSSILKMFCKEFWHQDLADAFLLIIHFRGWRQQRLVCESRIVHRMPAPTRGAPTPPATTRQGSGRDYHVYSTTSSDAIYTAYNYVPVIFTDSNIRLSQRIASIRNAPAKDASADTRAPPPPATTQQRRRWRTLLYILFYIKLC